MHVRSKFILYAVVLLLLFEFGFQLGHRTGLNSHISEPKTKVDTVFVWDTMMAYRPIFKERQVVKKVPVPVPDTVTIHDTLFVYLDREQVIWQDSLARVYASGIMTEIDSVQHFIRERVITVDHFHEVTKKARWSLGLQAGYGASKEGLCPYVGMGVTYNLLSW